ncbi:S-adenosyl-L-methionine-dependent methyltransferase [Aspergillus alliaceus]|uniref:S-adenosyl-L-methionine-dependent methyltransferase n=1 Tax=Petromyces alliaceus TaxID=209559 RepID=UPI0012A65B6F|nr:S-adenosyl-L-methionine-dependent methyltransferase [Aspergillus alliaceus]KAB8235889.1 S-adenosyl-L-methionine-dependent methyltransferase [Aspergillus alliaceus]
MPHINRQQPNGATSKTATIDEKIALVPNAPQQVDRLLKEISVQGQELCNGRSEARLRLVEAAQSLVYALETPREATFRYCWSHVTAFPTIEACVDLGIFPLLASSDTPKSVAELAEATGAEEDLLGRLLKHLAALGVVVETGPDEYRASGFSTALAIPCYGEAFACLSGCTIPALQALPAWLKENNYRSPTDPEDSPFTMGFNTDLHFFEWINTVPTYPALPSHFNGLMSAYHQGRPSWMDVGFYPVEEMLINGAQSGKQDVFLVDVGGNKGHDIMEFHRKWPNAPGRLILQDLPAVVGDIPTIDRRIEPMAHDFFTAQPVKGARANYLHSILHDWSDEACQKILTQLMAAMVPGYSKLLINENVIPSTGAHWQTTSLDIIMMVDVASRERTERAWYQLIESVGLKALKVWTVPDSVDSLIECELA